MVEHLGNRLYPTQQLTGVAETLLFTLYARALETQQPQPLLQDETALAMLQHLDYDFAKLDGAWKTLTGTVIRAIEIDRLVQAFLDQHPHAVVINLASGLCTRYCRLQTKGVHWYEVDFPEVIALRRQFLPEHEQYHFVPSSVLEFSWMDKIQRHTQQPLLVLMEGFCMYLTEAENQKLLLEIQHRFSPVELIFDVHSRDYAPSVQKTDAVTRTNAILKSGLDRAQEITSWTSGVTILSETSLSRQLALYPQRLPWWIRPIRHLLFKLQPNLSEVWRLIHLSITNATP
jgi:O-methyltransferase involved in polyketide biosynthesis